ncbi:sugar phosphate isomerase/epimerase family protein [Zavarzinella formosa]|uniref:sugar phosphate isomerase/epimerase family protein n=1 Tax=Zavarzinella formosa TaxID=360055 RepID=UPI0002E1B821|nr:sugar phosphate isomerase/epimerase [Zavarzinella formosa]
MPIVTRRDLLAASAGLAVAATMPSNLPAKDPVAAPFGFCLNTSTIRGQKLPITEIVDLAAKAGYDAIEPWLGELQNFVTKGGILKDLGKRIADAGLKVESSIGFAKWIVDDDAVRKQGLDEAKRDMEMVLAIGGKRIAAPPAGATEQANMNLNAIADRYKALAEVGAKVGVIPEVEVWGFSKTLSKLGETVLVAMESAHPQACVLPDIYHLFKGGSGFEGLKMLQGKAIGIFHVNDYPQDKDAKAIKDADRVFPGDGVAPLSQVFRTLREIGYKGMLSLELFNPEYYKRDAFEVLKTGLEKTKAAVAASL